LSVIGEAERASGQSGTSGYGVALEAACPAIEF
jgi:hypothetical protein